MSSIKIILLLLLLLPTVAMAQDEYDSTSYSDETYTTEEVYATDEDYSYGSFQEVEPSTLPVTKQYSEEQLQVEKFDKEEWKKIVGSTNYAEKKPKTEEESNSSSVNPIDISSPWGGQSLTVVFYILVIGIVVFILWAVLKNMSFDMKLKKIKVMEDAIAHIENIQELDIDSYLARARAEKNYRLAIRLYYLGLLKRLNENGLIVWKKDKTNLDYLSEVFNRDFHHNEIRKLTLAYEETWYGERRLTEDSFHHVTAEFETMFSKINSPVVPR